MTIQLKAPPIQSDTIEGIAHDKDKRIMYVRFSGTTKFIYGYHDLTESVYEKVLAAPSIGSYIRKEIIPAHYCEKIPMEQF